ncbi:MAG TPA: DUF481 domain-containing protein [Gemmatimonadales bacterium]|nr:DUF481 domain-containing protein [Gemmatimonadales bacterium]
MSVQLFLAATLAALPPNAPGPGDSTPGPRWRFGGELSFTDMRGNKALSLLVTAVEARRTGGRLIDFGGRWEIRYGRSNGAAAVETYAAALDGRLLPRGAVSPFVTGSVVRDPVRNLSVRVAAALGAGVDLVRRGDDRVTLGLGMLQDYEARALPEGSAEPAEVSLTRFNLRLDASATLRDGVVAEHQSLLEPAADDLGDYRLSSKTSVRVLLSRRLSLQTTYTFDRDATPPPGVEFEDDRTLSAGLRVAID